MVAVTRDTLAVKAGWFMRSLLRHNLIDPASRTAVDWIFKDTPQKELTSFPVVIVETSLETEKGNVNYSKRARTNLTYSITIFSDHINYKHSLVDSIVKMLEDSTSHDEDSVTMAANRIGILSISVDDVDAYIEEPLMMYGSVITVNCVFSGK